MCRCGFSGTLEAYALCFARRNGADGRVVCFVAACHHPAPFRGEAEQGGGWLSGAFCREVGDFNSGNEESSGGVDRLDDRLVGVHATGPADQCSEPDVL